VPLIGEYPENRSILGEEERAAGKDVDFVLCGCEQSRLRSRTRRTMSRAVMACPLVEVKAVYPVSATRASEIQQRS
jgi:hypothetical protein